MARITVEDCYEKINNRFELVALASQRAKSISRGAPITVERNNDKNAVIALREIGIGNIDIDHLREELIINLQTRNKVDIIEDENLHAENQDAVIDEINMSDESMHMFDHDTSDDLGIDSFDDNIVDEDNDRQ